MQAVGVAEGLHYLHSNDIIHGDITGVSFCFGQCQSEKAEYHSEECLDQRQRGTLIV